MSELELKADADFEEKIISKVEPDSEGAAITFADGWSLYVKSPPVEIKPGSVARVYPRGIGRPVRGLYIDGVRVWHRTPAEDKAHGERELYGADAKEWLRRWDEGRSVWSLEMGGLGPGYEQCIQITTAEAVRHLVNAGHDPEGWAVAETWEAHRQSLESDVRGNPIVSKLALSGAQFGAAMGLALAIYRKGPLALMTDPDMDDRKIQVSRYFPVPDAAVA